MRQAIKKTVLWNFARTTWQYDLLCALILAFIFLTPAHWFAGKERDLLPIENSKNVRLIISSDLFSPEHSESARLQRVRELSGNNAAEIVSFAPRSDASGKLTAYEIEIR